MPEKQKEKLFQIFFKEVQKYAVIVKAPDQKSAERWASEAIEEREAFRNCRDGYYGELDENSSEFSCQQYEGDMDHDVRVNKLGDQIDEDPEEG